MKLKPEQTRRPTRVINHYPTPANKFIFNAFGETKINWNTLVGVVESKIFLLKALKLALPPELFTKHLESFGNKQSKGKEGDWFVVVVMKSKTAAVLGARFAKSCITAYGVEPSFSLMPVALPLTVPTVMMSTMVLSEIFSTYPEKKCVWGIVFKRRYPV